jgi:hypothetical protein
MEKNNQLFIQLLYIFNTSAMQSLGRIKSPITGKIEKDFNQARQAINMLEMLKEKTSGNLSPELSESLNTLLNETKVSYLQESNKT